MSSARPIPGFGKIAIDFGERGPTPLPHHHVGPWAVYQAYEPSRHTPEDRARAALAMRYLVMDPAGAPREMIALGRRALAAALVARLSGEALDDAALFVRVAHPRRAPDGATALGYA